MRVLCWISGHANKDMNRNEYIREKVAIASILEKMVESCLRWFEHLVEKKAHQGE